MPDTLKYDLEIEFSPDGYTRLNTPLHWAVYNENGEITDAGINGFTEFPIPLPARINVKGRQKKTVGKDGLKSILRTNHERFHVEMFDADGPISDEHNELFNKLKDVLTEMAPKDGHYFLNLRYVPHDEDEKENELTEPMDIDLATFIVFLDYLANNHA